MTPGWATAKYPGDAVRIALLIRDGEIGDVRIQDYSGTVKTNRYHVGAFLPGETTCSPGDTPKTWADRSAWCDTPEAANSTFLESLQTAKADGWADFEAAGQTSTRNGKAA